MTERFFLDPPSVCLSLIARPHDNGHHRVKKHAHTAGLCFCGLHRIDNGHVRSHRIVSSLGYAGVGSGARVRWNQNVL